MVCDTIVVTVKSVKLFVLILILLEYGLRHALLAAFTQWFIGLNPYSIGIWSATTDLRGTRRGANRLNPYSIGIWSATVGNLFVSTIVRGLNPYSIGIWSATRFNLSQINYYCQS